MSDKEATADAAHEKILELLERGGRIDVTLPAKAESDSDRAYREACDKAADARLSVDREFRDRYREACDKAADARLSVDREFRDRWCREQTAATILAALVKESDTDNCHVDWSAPGGPRITSIGAGSQRLVAYAVALTDALRAALRGGE